MDIDFLSKTIRHSAIAPTGFSTIEHLVRQNAFVLSRTRHKFDVIRLWEHPVEMFLSPPGILPFAVLSRTEDPCEGVKSSGICDRTDWRQAATE